MPESTHHEFNGPSIKFISMTSIPLAGFFRGDVVMAKIASTENIADPFTKPLTQKVFEKHLESMGVKYMSDWF